MAKRKAAAGERAAPLWSIPVSVADIPETGRRLNAVADAATREALATAASVAGLPRLDISVELSRHGRNGVRLVGQVSATVEQSCVVSLEPLQTEVAETFDLVFLPAAVDGALAAEAVAGDDVEPPEALHDGVVDIGAVAAEFLILGIDPYPRKPGAEFAAPPAEDAAADHPFAALAALKPRS